MPQIKKGLLLRFHEHRADPSRTGKGAGQQVGLAAPGRLAELVPVPLHLGPRGMGDLDRIPVLNDTLAEHAGFVRRR